MLKKLLSPLLLLLCIYSLNAQLIITQYYEGAGFNKWLEITNVGTATENGTFYLCAFNNAKADNPSGETPTNSILIATPINPCQVLLYQNSGAALPSYASGITTGVINFNEDDLMVISTTNDNTAWANRVDVIGDGSSWGKDVAFVRNDDTPSTTFNLGTWTMFTNAEVDAATSGTDEYLGDHTCTLIGNPAFNINPTSLFVNENSSFASFDVFINGTADCTVDIVNIGGTATQGADYSFSPSSLTFSGSGTTTQTITVTITDDTDVEGLEDIVLQLQNAGGAGACTIGTSDQITINILDNDGVAPQTTLYPCYQGQSLLDQLTTNFKTTTTLGYAPARDKLYTEIDNTSNTLSGIYTGFTIPLSATSTTPRADALALNINAEHAYPQSKGAALEPERSDMHSLFPAKDNVNSARSNCPYDEVVDASTGFWFKDNILLNSIPPSDIDAYSEKDLAGFDCGSFEPRENVKGDMARAVFYFYTMYKAACDSSDPTFFSGQMNVLRTWHQQDPVDAKEYARTLAVATYQDGKANPFVLDNSLVDRAYFSTDLTPSNNVIPTTGANLVYIADAECTDTSTGWTHYYKSAANAPVTTDDMLLLSVKKGTSAVVLTPSQVKIEVLAGAAAIDLSSAPYVGTPTWHVMRRYWDASPTTQPTGNVDVRFYYSTQDFNEVNAASSFVTTQANMFVYKVIGTDDPSPGTGHAGVLAAEYSQPAWTPTLGFNGTDHYAEFQVSSFSGGGLGGGGDDGALPVELMYLKGKKVRSAIALNWLTASELNAQQFIVERAANGQNFERIGTVQAKGNTTNAVSYNFSDEAPLSGTNYYRLKMIDLDASFEYSKVVEVRFVNKNAIELFPNPSKARVQFESTVLGLTQYRIVNTMGKTIRQGQFDTSIELSTSSLSAGSYFVLFQDKNGLNIGTKKMLILE